MSEKKVWDNRIAPKKKEHGKYPWDFKAPSYDNRTSCSVGAGDDYGVGFKQSTGKFRASSMESGPIPQKNYIRNGKDFVYKKDIEG